MRRYSDPSPPVEFFKDKNDHPRPPISSGSLITPVSQLTASISVFPHVFSGCACSYPCQCSAPNAPSKPYFTPSKRPFMAPPRRKRPSLPLHIYLCNCLRCHGDDSGTQSDWQTRLWHSILPGSIYIRPELQPATQTKSQLHTCTHTYKQTIYA